MRPSVQLDRATFAAHLGRHGLLGGRLDSLSDARLESIYLACAAGHRDEAAIAAIDAELLAKAAHAVVKLRGPSTLPQDVRQAMREVLFVSEPGARPKILDYAARSDLGTWLHAMAMRAGFALQRRRVTDGEGDDEALISSAVAEGDPQIDQMKAQDVKLVKAAFATALAAQASETRALLRQYYIEGLGVEVLGRVYGVAPSTISRRLAKAHQALLAGLRAELSSRLRVSAQEAESLVRSLRSRLDVSRLSHLLD
jgi:RNA polymerase sigma-70 factor (ECF subfamily)